MTAPDPGTTHFNAVMQDARTLPRLDVAVVHPVDGPSIRAAVEAAAEGLIRPVLVGPKQRILRAIAEFAASEGGNTDDFEIVDAEHSHAAAALAVALAASGRVGALMKGALHTDELLHPVVAAQSGLRTESRISHAYVLDTAAPAEPTVAHASSTSISFECT